MPRSKILQVSEVFDGSVNFNLSRSTMFSLAKAES